MLLSPVVGGARAAPAHADPHQHRGGGEGEEGFFSWLSEAQLHYTKTRSGEKRLKAVKVRLCDWLYRAILRDRQVLDYAAAYS